jgi:uncharacterized low-complexity protein
MMTRMTMIRLALASFLALGLALAAFASEEARTVSLTGKIVCAKCTLKKADATSCGEPLRARHPGAVPGL